MAEDYRDRWEDEEEEESGKEPVKPFFQTLIGRIVIGIGILIGVVIIQIIVSLIVLNVAGEEPEDISTQQLSEDEPILIKNAQTFSLGEMNLNLENTGAFLSVEVFLAYDGNQQDLRWELDKRIHQIRDKVRFILEKNSSKDIDSVDERNNILKPKIINRVNNFLKNGQIYDVYFKTFTIQYSPVS